MERYDPSEAFIPERDAHKLHLPVVITGLSGGGKSTVAAKVEQSGIIPAVTYDGRLTTRKLRNDGEQEGKDGRFSVPHAEFEDNPDLFYQYAKYGEQYGFSRRALRDCLNKGHTFIIGGEPDTALPIRNSINSPTERELLDDVGLKAITLLIRRPINEILLGLIERNSSDAEKLKRIEHIVKTQLIDGMESAYEVDYEVVNGERRLEPAVTETIGIIQAERDKQLRELFGNDFRLRGDAGTVSAHSFRS